MLRYKMLREVLKMEIGEETIFKITDNRFLYADNWCDEDGSWYTTLELVDGKEIDGKFELGEILEIVTLEYGNKEEIKLGIKYILSHCKRRKISW